MKEKEEPLDTQRLTNILQSSDSLTEVLNRSSDSLHSGNLSQYLNTLSGQRGLTIPQIVLASNLSKTYVYQLWGGERCPKRDVALRLALAMQLKLEDTQRQLSLSGNYITDLSPLGSCTGLTALFVDENPVEQAASLTDLTSLRELNLRDTRMTDLTMLQALPLDTLVIGEMPLCDFAPLTELKWLSHLTVQIVTPEQLAAVRSITSLEELLLRCTVPVTLQDFAVLGNLTRLDAAGSNLIDASARGVEKIPRLSYLNLSQMKMLDSLEPLTKMPALGRVELMNTSVADLTPLLRCPKLQQAMFSDNQREQVERQLKDAPFTIEYWDNYS